MTLGDIKSDLFNFFATHDTFSIEENFDNLYVLTSKEEKPFKMALIEKAFEEFVERKIVSRVDVSTKGGATKTTWILDKPLEQYAQTVELSYPVLAGITHLVNAYCDEVKNEEAKVDPLNIKEKDIQTLLLIIGHTIGGGNV